MIKLNPLPYTLVFVISFFILMTIGRLIDANMQEWVKLSLTGALMVSLWFAVFINRFKGKKNE